MPELSIVIPAYNEECRIEPVLDSVCNYCRAQKINFEIIVVNDGSTDNTRQIVSTFANKHREIKLLEHSPNHGKGFAVRNGVMAATGELVLINDADGSSPISEFEKLNTSISNGYDIAIGSRNKPDPSIKINALPYRTYIGNTFNRIVQSVLLPGIYDTQCGFKLLTNAAAKNIFSAATIDGYAFDVEILYLAKLRNFRIDEIPINWTNAAGSKVNIFIDSFKMLIEVLKIKSSAIAGKYSQTRTKSTNEFTSTTK